MCCQEGASHLVTKVMMRQESKGDEASSNFFYLGLGIPIVYVVSLILIGSEWSQD